jgi:very-short-patch-repair endonuclease
MAVHPFDPAVSGYFSTHHGVASRATLLDLGLSPGQIDHLVERRILLGDRRSAYRLAGTTDTVAQRLAFVCAAHPDVTVSHVTAGRAWQWRRLGRDLRIHALVPGHTSPEVPGVVLHRCEIIDPGHVVERDDGIRLTSPPRTLFDLAAILGDDQLESVIEQALAEERCTLATLAATVQSLRKRGRPGSARIVRVLAARSPDQRPVDSDLELRFERAVVSAGLPRPDRQVTVRRPDGLLARLDFFWPRHRVAVEIDHVTWHGGRQATAADNRRDRQLATLGMNVTRVTDLEITRDLPAVIRDLGHLLGARSREV